MSVISDIENKHIQGFELEDKIHDGENVVGCFYKNSGTINLININKQYDGNKGKEVDIKGFGRWYVYDIVPKQEKISSQLKLYDLSYRFDEEYDSSVIEFPCTNGEWAAAICLYVGLELGSSSFPNSEFELSEQPYLPDGATFRDAIKMIAESAGCFVQISTDNKVYIRWFDNTTIEIEDWFSLSQDSETNPINLIILGRGDVEDNIQYPSETPENPIELRIDDNQILYFNREEMIIPIYNQVNGFKFFPFKMKTDGRPSLKAGMRIQYTDIDGMQVETAVMYHKIEYKGGLDDNACYKSTIESYELKETSSNHQYSGTIEKRLSRAERITDKNNNQIIDIIEEQTEQGNKIAEQEITINTITNTVSETTTRLNNDYLTAEQVNAELDTAKDDIEVLQQKQAQTELTSEEFKVQIDSIINDGVSKVKTSMGYTFGDDGLIINKEDAETGTIIDEASVKVIDKTGAEEQDLLYAGFVKEDNEDYPDYKGQTIVASSNMIVQNYLVVPNSRFEAYENPVLGGKGTGAFEV